MNKLPVTYIASIVKAALDEDVGAGDITAALIPKAQFAHATIITREPMVVAGCDIVNAVFQQVDADVNVSWHVKDQDVIPANTTLCDLSGRARSLLTGERTALNFLQLLSGVATQTKAYVNALEGTSTTLLDTRKTIPGLRLAQKYAVRCGGGRNHRIGLFDAFLIKENHIAAVGSIAKAIHAARQLHPDKTLEIEVENLEEFHQALEAQPDIIMLDNFSVSDIEKAVLLARGRVKCEVSGNVTLETIQVFAKTGVDFISVGAITKHAKAIDLSMRVQ